MGHEEPDAVAQQFHGVGETGGDHRLAGRNCLDQDARGHLVGRVVGEQDDVGIAHDALEALEAQVGGVELDLLRDAEPNGLCPEALAVGLSVLFEYFGVGLAHDQVPRGRVQVAQESERLDGPLDALSGPEESPREDGGTLRVGTGGNGLRGDVGPVGDDGRLGHVDVVGAQAPVGGARHRDHGVGSPDDGLQDLLLANGRVHQDRVEYHDGGQGQLVEEGEDLLAVGPAEDPVLMLDDGDVEPVQLGRGPAPARRGAFQQFMHHFAWRPWFERIDDAHDAEVLGAGSGAAEMRSERGSKCCQPALGGRVGAQQSVGCRCHASSRPGSSSVIAGGGCESNRDRLTDCSKTWRPERVPRHV